MQVDVLYLWQQVWLLTTLLLFLQGLNCPFSHSMEVKDPCQHKIAHNNCSRKNCKREHDISTDHMLAPRPWAELHCVARNAESGYYPKEQRTDPRAKTGPSVSDSCGPRYWSSCRLNMVDWTATMSGRVQAVHSVAKQLGCFCLALLDRVPSWNNSWILLWCWWLFLLLLFNLDVYLLRFKPSFFLWPLRCYADKSSLCTEHTWHTVQQTVAVDSMCL